jgi:hypothetical protein
MNSAMEAFASALNEVKKSAGSRIADKLWGAFGTKPFYESEAVELLKEDKETVHDILETYIVMGWIVYKGSSKLQWWRDSEDGTLHWIMDGDILYQIRPEIFPSFAPLKGSGE